MARNQARVGQQTQTTGIDVGRLLIAAALVAAILTLGDLLINVVTTLSAGGNLDFAGLIEAQVDDIAGEIATLVAVVIVIQTGASKDGILRGAAVAFAGAFVNNVLFVLLNQFAEFDLGTILWPLASALFVVGIAMAYRLYNRQTILPGVDVRI